MKLKERIKNVTDVIFNNEAEFLNKFFKGSDTDELTECYLGHENSLITVFVSTGDTVITTVSTDKLLDWAYKLLELDRLKFQFGECDGAILLGQAYHACDAQNDRLWKCDAVKRNGNELIYGWVYWDFSDVDNYFDIEDASDYPWNETETTFEYYKSCNIDEISDISKIGY